MSSIKFAIMCLVAILLIFAILFNYSFDLIHDIEFDGTVDYLSDFQFVYYFPTLIELELYYDSNNVLNVGSTNMNNDAADKFIRYTVNPYEIGNIYDGKVIFPTLSIMEESNTDPVYIYDIPNYPFEIVQNGAGYILRSLTAYRGFGYFDQAHIIHLIYSFFAVCIQHIGNSFVFEFQPIQIGSVTLDGALIPVVEYIATIINGVNSIFGTIVSLFDIFGSAILTYGGT